MNRVIYIVIAIIAFLGFMLVMAPASVAVNVLRDDLATRVPDLSIGETSGTVWSGHTTLQYGRFPPLDASWTLDVLPLITGTASTRTILAGNGVQASIDADITAGRSLVRIPEMNVDAVYINQVAAGQGLSLTGTITATEVNLVLSEGWIRQLSGRLTWPGGLVHIQTPQQYYSTNLPALEGKLESATDLIRLDITNDQLQLVSLELRRDGWARVDVTYDFMNLAGIPIPGAENQDGQASAIVIEENVLY